jgi:hypothetical protein
MSLFIENGTMEIPLCRIISMQLVRLAFMNDIFKLQGDFYSGYHHGTVVFNVFLEGIDVRIVDVSPK